MAQLLGYARASGVTAPVGGAPVVVRSRGRSRWFVVEADPADPERGPVAVVSGYTSQEAATAALSRARSRASSSAGEGVVLQVRAADQISSRLVWDGQAGRGIVQLGGRRDHLGDGRPANTKAAGVSGLLPEPAGCAELLEQLKAGVWASPVRVARAAKTTCRGVTEISSVVGV